MWPFRPKAWLPPINTGPSSFGDWTDADIDYVSKAIRSHGQPEREGFRVFARVALNTLRGASAVELIARAMHESANPGSNADAPINPRSGHYMAGMPNWCMWVEYAAPAVAAIIERTRLSSHK